MTGKVHIIGAGLAGLSAAVRLASAGVRVALYEATKVAGGRCRSFYDQTLQAIVDNGSHVVLGANPAVFEHLESIEVRDRLTSINPTGTIPFYDLQEDERWSLDPGQSQVPWWMLNSDKRPPKTHLWGYLRGLGLMFAGPDKTVSDIIPSDDETTRRFWEPFVVAVMNTNPEVASAALLGKALKRAMAANAGGFQAFVPTTNLADTFVTPAIDYLKARGAELHFEAPAKSVSAKEGATTIQLRSSAVDLEPQDAVILALPPWSPLLDPFRAEPSSPNFSPILNVHYKYQGAAAHPAMTGVVGGRAHWIFARGNIISVTVSAATALQDMIATDIADLLWAEVNAVLKIQHSGTPLHRVIVEKRATPLQDCSFANTRPSTRTPYPNVFLAGDWLNTGLPCTLESAIESGKMAADLALTRG